MMEGTERSDDLALMVSSRETVRGNGAGDVLTEPTTNERLWG
jgi:hypothetical protein